jgi:hypothetical protein
LGVVTRPRYTQAPLRDILVLLSHAEGGTAAFSALVDRLRATFTPNEYDLEPRRYANSEAAWIDYLVDNRTSFVRVGWVTGSKEVWTITPRGRDALLVYSTPEQLRIAAREGRTAAKLIDADLAASELANDSIALAVESGVEGAPDAATDERYDVAHVEALRKLVRAMEEFVDETSLSPLADYPLREAIYFWWRRREFKRTGRLYASKYPISALWSPAAAARAATSKRCGGIVIEHVIPSNVTRQRLRDTVDDPVEFRRVLDSEVFFVITKEEDDSINSAGYMSAIPDSGDPLDRYRLAGLDPATFAPLQLP